MVPLCDEVEGVGPEGLDPDGVGLTTFGAGGNSATMPDTGFFILGLEAWLAG